MTYAIVFLIAITTLIITKLRAISLRNNLDSFSEKKLLVTASLTVIFLATNLTLPYPQSLYWFIILGIIAVGSILSFNVIKKEFHRFMELKPQDRVINVLFYGLLFVVTNIYI